MDEHDAVFNKLLNQLFRHFDDSPRLQFTPGTSQNSAYRFPRIAANSSPGRRTPAPVLKDFFDAATCKYFFDTTRGSDWRSYVQFPNSRLVRERGSYTIQNTTPDICSDAINRSKEDVEKWLFDMLVPSIVSQDGHGSTFVLGEPGSGKSTLFKYLLNVYRHRLLSNRVIFSRFEALKFRRMCANVTKTTELFERLSDYLFQIVFRDLVFAAAFHHNPDGTYFRTDTGWFRSRSEIDRLLEVASEFLTTSEYEEGRYAAFIAILKAVESSPFNHKALRDVPFAFRVAIVKRLAPTFHFCVLFDGLDFVSVESRHFDDENFQILEILIDSFAYYGARTLRKKITLPFRLHSLFVVRRSTYASLVEATEPELRLSRIARYDVAPVRGEVILCTAIRRGARAILKEATPINVEAQIISAADIALRYIDIYFGIDRRNYGALKLFNGNIRDCFNYLRRVLEWIVSEGEIVGDIPAHERRLEFIAAYMVSDAAKRILMRRGYRLVEFLLFREGSSFQNALEVLGDDAGDRVMGTSPRRGAPVSETRLAPNKRYLGHIDNIFNYHIQNHSPNRDPRCLLEKIRILQLCPEDDWVRVGELHREIVESIGYRSSDMETSTRILLHGGFLRIDMTEGKAVVQRTPRGTIFLTSILSRSVYLEHVFHKTLFPAEVLSLGADSVRQTNFDRWTVASIRNYFVLLAYIRFLEEAKDRGAKVPTRLRLVPTLSEAIMRALIKILWQDFIKKKRRPINDWFVSHAVAEIGEVIEVWRSRGIISR